MNTELILFRQKNILIMQFVSVAYNGSAPGLQTEESFYKNSPLYHFNRFLIEYRGYLWRLYTVLKLQKPLWEENSLWTLVTGLLLAASLLYSL